MHSPTVLTSPALERDALQRVLGVARLLGASSDRQEILQVIIDAMRDTLDAERATVFEYDPQTSELFTTVAHGLGGGASAPARPSLPMTSPTPPAGGSVTESALIRPAAAEPDPPTIRIPISHGIAGESARTQQIINVHDAYADPRFNREVDRVTGFRTRSILTIPLLAFDGELIGVAQVLNKRGRPFDGSDEQIAVALASQAAVAIKRGRLIEAQLKREKLERDLQLARLIQQQTIPSTIPILAGFDIAAWNEPAEETGGDAYDIIGFNRVNNQTMIVDSAKPAEWAALLIADATGHGIGPALMATGVRGMLRMAVRVGTRIDSIIQHLNRQVCQDVPSGRFITVWIGMIDSRNKTLTSFSAGQAPLLFYRASADDFQVLDADEMPFGIIEDWEATASAVLPLEPGDMYLVMSDGFFESTNGEGEQWGVDRAIRTIRAHRDRPAREIIAALRQAVLQFTDDRPAADDRTAILIKRTADAT